MLNLRSTTRALLADRRAAAAVIVALATPALLGAAGFGVEAGLLEAKRTQLQTAADAAAAAGREHLDPGASGTPGNSDYQTEAVNYAVQYGNTNVSSSVTPADVSFFWYNIVPGAGANDPPVGAPQAPIANGFYSGYSNAVQVTSHIVQPLVFGKLLGVPSVSLNRTAMAYKCSNNIEPESNVNGTLPSDPTQPAMYSSWASPGHSEQTSYWIRNTAGHRSPVFKFYSPYDYEVSWTARFDDGAQLQVETYCKGWTLVVPDNFDLDTQPPFGHAHYQRGLIKAGGLIDSFDADPDPNHQVAFNDTTYYDQNITVQLAQSQLLPNQKLQAFGFPGFLGTQYWWSTGEPTPGRQSIIVN